MAATDDAEPCPACVAGLRRSHLRSQIQYETSRRRAARMDRWHQSCERCGDTFLVCTVHVWPLGQQAPDPTPPQDYDWPTHVLAAVVAPEEVPMPDLSQPALAVKPWPRHSAAEPEPLPTRQPGATVFPELTEQERAKLARSYPRPETIGYVRDVLRRWQP